MSGTFTETNTVSLNIPGLVSPAAKSARLPDMESPLARSIPLSTSLSGSFQPFGAASAGMRSGPLGTIPQSPTTGSIAAASPGDILNRGDYFSSRRKADPSPDRSQPATTPGEKEKDKSAPLGQTPGGGSFMGKFKGFGKKKQAEVPVSPVVEAPTPPPEDTVSHPFPVYAHADHQGPKFTERETAQLNILDIVRAHAFNPPPPWEAPPVNFPSNTSLLISEEAKDAGAWVVTYRSQVSSTERDLEALEMNSPLWLLDYLFTSRSKQKDPVKLTFILEPAPGSGLKEMPEG
jgi:WD repeat-containing protein 48